MGRQRKSYPGVAITLRQIDAAEHLYEQLEEWRCPLEALDELHKRIPGFGASATLLKTTAVSGLLATQTYALVAMAEHVQNVLAGVQLREAGPELVEKMADFRHKDKIRKNVSFASKFAHFFIDPERFPMKDSFSTAMLEFHLGTENCVRTDNIIATGYTAFIENLKQLKKRDGLDGISNRRLDCYLWFAGKYRAFQKEPPFDKQKNSTKLFSYVHDPRYETDLATILGG